MIIINDGDCQANKINQVNQGKCKILSYKQKS